jgi:hypothetical protein
VVLVLSVVLFRLAGVDLPRVRALWRLLWVKALVYAGTIVVIVHLFFVAPLLPDSQQQARCVQNVHLTSWLGYAASCDSFEFIFDARNPGTLSVAKSFRQSGPLQITVAALMERVEKRVVEPTVGRPYKFPISPGWFPLRELVSGYEPVLAGIAITLLVSLPFFGLQGFYRDRLAFNLVVPLVVLAGILAVRLRERLRRPAGNLALAVPAVTAFGVLLGALLKVGPYV